MGENMSETESPRLGRREFLLGAGAGAALLHADPSEALKRAARLSPNEKVNFAGIGVGSQGGGDVDAVVAAGGNLVALCDVDHKYAAKKFAQYPSAKPFKDYRIMLDRMGKDIDAVVIGTPHPRRHRHGGHETGQTRLL
jgi:hypothetical protein